MLWGRLAACTFLAILVVASAEASGDEGSESPHRLNVNVAAGSHLHEGGNLQAVSLGYTQWRGLTVLLNVERNHVATRIRRYPNGFSAARGGTLTFLSGEVRYAVWHHKRVSPFGFAGVGYGLSRPNVNDLFPNRVTNTADVVYVGGGMSFQPTDRLGVWADAKFQLMAGRQEIGALRSVRAGVTWRF